MEQPVFTPGDVVLVNSRNKKGRRQRSLFLWEAFSGHYDLTGELMSGESALVLAITPFATDSDRWQVLLMNDRQFGWTCDTQRLEVLFSPRAPWR